MARRSGAETAKAAAQAKTAPTAKPPRPPVTLPAAAGLSNDLRTLAVNLTILLVILIVGPVIVGQFWRNQVLIEPIAVPPALVRTGLTPEVAAARLWDGLQQVKADARTGKQTVNAIPDSQQVDFSIPDAGLSIDALIYYVREFFNVYETRVSGEIRCATEACVPSEVSIRLRVVTDDLTVIPIPPRGDIGEDDYFRLAASEVMGVLDPFTAIAAEAETAPQKARMRAKRLILEDHPDAEWAHNLLGNLSMDLGEIDVALGEYQAALSIDKDFVPGLLNLGNVMRIKGDLAGAKAAFDSVEKLDPGNVTAADGFADLALLAGDKDKAIAHLLAAAKADPLSTHHLFTAGTIEWNAGNVEAARGYLLQALEIDPTDELVLTFMSQIAWDDYGQMERLYRTAADLSPMNADIQATHAQYLGFLQDDTAALARIDAALRLDAENPRYHRTRARELQALGRYDEALAALGMVEALNPGQADTASTRGLVLIAMNRKPEAVEAYRRALELLPPDDMTRLLIQRITENLEAEIAAPPPVP